MQVPSEQLECGRAGVVLRSGDGWGYFNRISLALFWESFKTFGLHWTVHGVCLLLIAVLEMLTGLEPEAIISSVKSLVVEGWKAGDLINDHKSNIKVFSTHPCCTFPALLRFIFYFIFFYLLTSGTYLAVLRLTPCSVLRGHLGSQESNLGLPHAKPVCTLPIVLSLCSLVSWYFDVSFCYSAILWIKFVI